MQIKQQWNDFEQPSSNWTRHFAIVFHQASVINAGSDGFLQENLCFNLFFFSSQ